MPGTIVMFRPRAVILTLAFASALIARDSVAQQIRAVDGIVRSAADTTLLAGVRVRVLETAYQLAIVVGPDGIDQYDYTDVATTGELVLLSHLDVVNPLPTASPMR